MLKDNKYLITWDEFLNDPLVVKETTKIKELYTKYNNLTPNKEDLNNRYKHLLFKDIKVVIIGQDPYPKDGVANGVAFATKNQYMALSLRNILKLIFNEKIPSNIDTSLLSWIKQGVLLINTTPITQIDKPLSFHNQFHLVDLLINYLNKHHTQIVYMLWGREALKYASKINDDNFIIISSHPSPLSCNKSLLHYPNFNQSHCFNKCNEYLLKTKQAEINWKLIKIQ